jgi:hypothetical protein
MTGQRQSQIGGSNNIQSITNVLVELSVLLNEIEGNLKQRSFASDDVKKVYVGLLAKMCSWIHTNETDLLKKIPYIMYPFKTLATKSDFQTNAFIEALLEALTLIAFSDINYTLEEHHLNLRLHGRQTCGLYYHPSGSNDLVDSFIRLVKALKEANATLPNGMIFIVLRCVGAESYLDPVKIKNILDSRDIFGADPYIKPLQGGSPKCVTLTSYVINKCTSVEEAKTYIKGILASV